MARYSNDPRWIVARWAGKDAKGTAFQAGDRVFYYPGTKTILAGAEGEIASLRFAAERADEAFVTGSW